MQHSHDRKNSPTHEGKPTTAIGPNGDQAHDSLAAAVLHEPAYNDDAHDASCEQGADRSTRNMGGAISAGGGNTTRLPAPERLGGKSERYIDTRRRRSR